MWSGSFDLSESRRARLREERDNENARLSGNPYAVDFPTTTELVALPSVIWDVNRYYRLLGFEWPYRNITRRDLLRAYRDNGGPDNTFMTNAFKQLLDPVVRRRYDRMALGELYVDELVEAWMKQKALLKARKMQAQYPDMSEQEAMRRMGFEPVPPKPEPNEDLTVEDIDREVDRKKDRPAASIPAMQPAFLFGFYQWRTQCADLERLAAWQVLLVQSFSNRRVVARLAVGFHGRMVQKWLLGAVGNRLVVYLHADEQPTSEMAEAVVDRVVSIQLSEIAKRESQSHHDTDARLRGRVRQ